MVENAGMLEDTCGLYSVLPILLWWLLLLLFSMRLQSSRALGLLLVTLLTLPMLHCSWLCEALCTPSTTLTSRQGVPLSLPHSHFAPSCSPQRSDRTASNLGQQSCRAASSASSSNQQRALLSLVTAKPHARVRVFGGGTADRAVRAERESDGLVSLLLRPIAHGCCCSCRRRSTRNARQLANFAAGSEEPTSRQERCRSTSSSWIDSLLSNKHVASKRQQTPKHLCCCQCNSTWNCSPFCVGGVFPDACLYQQRPSCKRVATRSSSTQEARSRSCLLFPFRSSGEAHAGSASLGRLGAFVAAGMSACLLPAAGVSPRRFRMKESLPAFSQCSEKGSVTLVGETARWQLKGRSALPWRWKGSTAQPAAAVGPRAAAAQELFAYSGLKVRDSTCTCLVVANCSCRGRIAAASACCRYVVGGLATFCGAHSNRRKTLPFVHGTARNLCVPTKEASASTPAAAAAGKGGDRRERARHPPKEERILTLPQLERELHRRHRAVGLAIKAGDAVLAFKEFDMHLRCAAATVKKWMMMHHSCAPGAQILQQQQPCGRWKPDSIEEPSSLQSDQQQGREGQHHQEGQGEKGEEKEVQQQEHGQSRQQQSGEQRLLQQGQGSREREEDSELVPLLHVDSETLLGEVRGRQTRRKVDVVENSSRPRPSCVSTLLKLFVKSASGVLNLCCMNSSDEALRSTRDLYGIARQVLHRLKEYHLLNPLNTSVGNAFLTVAAAAGDTEAVAATLLLMQLQGARPQRKGYDALLRILLRRGEGYCRLREADLLSRMLEQRLPPTPEQLFALLLRDAARVSAQLEKEQLAAEKLNHILQEQKHQAAQQPPAPACRPQQRQEPVMPEDASLHMRARRAAETQKKEEDKKEEETDGDAGVEGLTGCSEAPVVRRLPGRSGNLSNLPLSEQEKKSKPHATALAAAQAALVEETWWSVHVLRDFVAAAEDALTLLQQVVSEQLPLLSEVAAGRFVAALRNLRLPPIAHISRVVIRHQAGSTAAHRHSYGQDGLPVHVGEAYISAEPPEAAPAPGDKGASQEPSRIIDEGTCNSTHCARGGHAPGAAAKPCGGAPVVQKRQDPTAGAGSGEEEEVQRGYAHPKDHDCSQQSMHPHDTHTQQQQRFHQRADPAEHAISLQRSAVCAGCGTRLQRVHLSSNERRLLRLGVLKLSAMLHPRQLRALLAFEAALSSRQFRCPAPPSAAASAHSVAAQAAAGGGGYHLQQERQAGQGHGGAVSAAAVEKSGLPLEVETQEPAARIVHPGLPSACPRSTASFCGTEQIAEQGSSAEGTLKAAGGNREAAFVAQNHGRAERISSQVGCAHWWRPMKRSTRAPLSSSNGRFFTSASSRFTVVLDAANIAYNSQNRQEGVFSYPQIERVRQELLGRGEQPLIILPAAYYWGFGSQRSRKSDGGNRTENVTHGKYFAKSADVDSSRSSSNRIEGARESLHAGLEEKSNRLFSGARWPPEASRLWICRMGLCPLCIDEIKVPNRCKKSSRWASCSRTPGTFPAGRCLSVGGASKGGTDRCGAEKTSPESPATSGSERYSAGFLFKGGQRLMCLDRALLRLWEQEGCLFICRSGAHDDHYHLLASLSACSGESRAAFSPASVGLRGVVVYGRVETPDDAISARRQQGHAEPATQTGELQDEGAGQLSSSRRIHGEEGTLPTGTGQHQCNAVRKPCGSVRSSAAPVKEQHHRLSAENLLDIMLGMQRDKPGVQMSPQCTEEEGQLCGRTYASAGAATVQAQQSLWHRLWQSRRTPDDEVKSLHDFQRPAASSLLSPVSENRITSGPNTSVSACRDEPGAIPSAPAYLGYSWDDIGCTRYVRKSGGVERLRAPGTSLSSREEAHFPIALLTNDRFRDHRLSSQQRTAFKHWRQLALLPYVFQRRQTPGRNGLTVAEVSPAESSPQHTGAPVWRSARRMHGGAQGQRHDSSTKQQVHRESAVSLSTLSPAAGAVGTLGDLLDDIHAVTIQQHLSDGGDAAGRRPESNTREASCQDVLCSNGMLEEKKREEDDRVLAEWTARPTRRAGEDSLKIGTDVWDGEDAVSPRGRHTNEWSSDGLDFLMQRVVSGGFSDWDLKNDFYGQTERIKRVTRVEKVEGSGKRYVDYAGDEVVPQLFIGMLRPLTRRVQVSLKTAPTRTVQAREKFNAWMQAATELPVHTSGQEYLRGGSRILVNSSSEATNQMREPPFKGNTSFDSRTRAFPVVGEKYLSSSCFHPRAALSLLTLYSTSMPCKDVADSQYHWVWHIPLRKPDDEALQHADDLFETSWANMGVPRPKAHISTSTSDGQQELHHGVLTTPARSSRSWEKSSINTPSAAAECTCISTKTDQISTVSPGKELFFTKNVFFDPDVLTQHSDEYVQGEEASEGSDTWLGIDLSPVYQLLRAREQFLDSVAE